MKFNGQRLLCGLVILLAIASVTPVNAEWNKGLAAFNSKDYATAVKEFEEVTKTNEDYAGGYYMKGLAEKGLGKASQAIASLRKAVEKAAGNPAEQTGYKVALGQTLAQTNQFNDAYSVLSTIQPSSIDASKRSSFVLIFAQAATKTNRPAEAIKALRAQIGADSKNAGLQQALGAAYSANGDDAKAFESFKKAFELNSKDLAVGRWGISAATSVARRTSNAQQKNRFFSEAAKLSERLASADGTFEHYLLAGESWMGAKEYTKALTWYDKAMAKQPSNSLVHFYRGQCYSSTKKWDTALKELQEALKGGTTGGKLRKQIYNQLGFVYDNKGDYTKAKEMYREAGSSGKVAEMDKKQEAADQNKKAQEEKAEYEKKIKALETQISELEALGDVEEATRIREFLNDLKKD